MPVARFITWLSKPGLTLLTPICLIAYVAALASGFFTEPFVSDTADEAYEIMNAMDYKNAPMAPLTSYISSIVGSHFGFGWLTFRYLTWIINVLAVAIGAEYYYRLSGNLNLSLLLGAFCVALVVMVLPSSMYYGWDTYTALFLTILIVGTLSMIYQPTIAKAIILGIVSAIMFWVRLPNLYAAAVVLVFIYISSPKQAKLRLSAAYILATMIATAALLLIMYGSFGSYFIHLKANNMGAHGLGEMFRSTCTSFYGFLVFGASIVALHWFVCKMRLDSHHGWKKVAIFVFVLWLFWLEFRFAKTLMIYRAQATYFTMGSGAIILMYVLLSKIRRESRWSTDAIALMALMLLALDTAVGSNTGLIKYLVSPIVPIIFYYCQKYLRGNALYTAIIATIVLVYLCFRTSIETTYHHFTEAKYETPGPMGQGIYLPDECGYIASSIDSDIRDSATKQHIIIGESTRRYMYEYLFGWRNPVTRHAWGVRNIFDDDSLVRRTERMIKSQGSDATIFMIPDSARCSKMEHMLQQNAELVKTDSLYKVFRVSAAEAK